MVTVFFSFPFISLLLHPDPLAGPFQSDALLVPEHCLFDHIHNQTRCWDFDQWNRTATGACRDRGMRVKSFAMLLPCGIDVFSGVEFVCCPFKPKKGWINSPLVTPLYWTQYNDVLNPLFLFCPVWFSFFVAKVR